MSRPRQAGNLPAEATTFIGRRRELSEIRRKLTSARLVSLVGPGGVGKTRLGIRAATELSRSFADGAWLVELGEVSDGALAPAAVLAALDLRDQAAAQPLEILVAYLRDRRLLLLLDNCEHLLDAAARLVSEILRAAPDVSVIATSRELLQVPGEYVVPVPPLDVPSGDGGELLGPKFARTKPSRSSPSGRRLPRARSSSPPRTRPLSCRCAGGSTGCPSRSSLPQSGREFLSVEQIVDRLSDRFALLTGGGRGALPRHQTLRMAIDWSFDQLAAPEQVLFRRLCVFAARFTLEDVSGVCTSVGTMESEALDLLTSLVDKSLVTTEEVSGTVCYRLHETMREYGDLKLLDADERDLLRERCLEHYRRTCRRLADEARYHLVEWLAWADLEIDNVRAVLHECVAHQDLARGLDIAASLRYYWITHGTTEAVRWLDELLLAEDASPVTMVRAYYLRSWLSLLQDDAVAARVWIAQGVAIAREEGQPALISESLSMAASAESLAGDAAAALRSLDEVETINSRLDDYPATIEFLMAQSIQAAVGGDLEAFRALATEGVNLSRGADDLYQLDAMLRSLGMVAMMAGDPPTARRWFAEGLQVARHLDNRLTQFYGLLSLAWCAANTGQARVAAQLLGAGAALGAQTGAVIGGPSAPFEAGARQSALDALGESAFNAEFKVGQHLTRDVALRLALGEAAPAAGSPPESLEPSPLAKRELEVAQLVAEGTQQQTNRGATFHL